MRGGYTLKPLSYGVHNRCVQLVEFIEDNLDKYMGRDRYHGGVLINL